MEEDYRTLDAQHKCIVLKEEVEQLRAENKALRQQLEDTRMALVKVESAWVNLKNQMMVK